VPGDVISKTCTYSIAATGDHLRATLAATGGAVTGVLPLQIEDQEFTVGGTAVTEISEADHGETLTATISVTLPLGATVDNTSKTQTATLSDYVVTATQVHD